MIPERAVIAVIITTNTKSERTENRFFASVRSSNGIDS